MSHRVTELYCIMPIGNIPSVMQYGILSHEKASTLAHTDISLPDVQDRRKNKRVPGGLALHQYANLYFCARNPMMYKRQACQDQLCVLRVNRQILLLPDVVLTDQNAASNYVRFYKSPQGLHHINFDDVFAENWNHPEDQIAHWRHASIKCAEVLVPNSIDVEYIDGAYVANSIALERMKATEFRPTVTINAKMFFA